MSGSVLEFDHIHLVSRDPRASAQWYVDHLGGEITRVVETRGARQVAVSFGSFVVLVRGPRGEEAPTDKGPIHWGIDHFGVRVRSDFDAFCASLKQKGVTFQLEPTQINPTTRIAFIDAPEGVTVELVGRSGPS
jgi:catechol 2,3-dioxygenase-like lactoylglutathione lyase family enzyme